MKRLVFLFALMAIFAAVNVKAQVNPTPGTTQTDVYYFTYQPSSSSSSSSNWHTFRPFFYHYLRITIENLTSYPDWQYAPGDMFTECEIVIEQKETLGVKLWGNESKSFVYEVPNGTNFLSYVLSIVLLTPGSSLKVTFEYD